MKLFFRRLILHYLRLLAKIQLQKIRLIQKIKGSPLVIIGITGSAGKTSTLNLLQTVLSTKYITKTNSGSNSESGIPLNILGLSPKNYSILDWLRLCLLSPLMLLINWRTYQIYLVEMGIDGPDSPQNMSYLLSILKPNISIFLNVSPVHSHNFDTKISNNITGKARLEQITSLIANEKAKIVNQLSFRDSAIINTFDPAVVASTQTTLAQKYTIGTDSSSYFQIISAKSDSKSFTLHYRLQKQKHQLQLKSVALPLDYTVSIASSLIVASILDIPQITAINSLTNHLRLPPSRNSLLIGINQSTIIDSSYNSSPLSCSQMLELLNNYPSPKIAVLGDMRELGQQSAYFHHQIGLQALKSANTIITIGPETKTHFPQNSKIHSFNFWWQAADWLKKNLPQKSTILVKGSQNTIYLEELVKSLIPASKLNNYLSNQLICRQSKYWQKLKDDFKKANS